MRYRKINLTSDVSRDVGNVLGLLGAKDYWLLLEDIGQRLRKKGYVAEVEDMIYGLELQLYNVEHNRRRHPEGLLQHGIPPDLHEAGDFLIGVGQTIPFLSERAKQELKARLRGGLKTEGLRPIQHEFRVAASLSNLGCEVSFSDLEGADRCDFLAEKAGCTYEVEAKALSIFSGSAIHPADATRMLTEARKRLIHPNSKKGVPLIEVKVKERLPKDHAGLRELIKSCASVSPDKKSLVLPDGTTVTYLSTLETNRLDMVARVAREDAHKNGVLTFVGLKKDPFVIRLLPHRKSQLDQNIIRTISESAKSQFSKQRPGVIWCHVDFITPGAFKKFVDGALFGNIAAAAFRSEKRRHITQLVFSGGAFLERAGSTMRSQFQKAIYNSPHTEFDHPHLFPGGRNLTSLAS